MAGNSLEAPERRHHLFDYKKLSARRNNLGLEKRATYQGALPRLFNEWRSFAFVAEFELKVLNFIVKERMLGVRLLTAMLGLIVEGVEQTCK